MLGLSKVDILFVVGLVGVIMQNLRKIEKINQSVKVESDIELEGEQ